MRALKAGAAVAQVHPSPDGGGRHEAYTTGLQSGHAALVWKAASRIRAV
jgi:hypothetical protein